jgi:Tol biopolymer transport system component
VAPGIYDITVYGDDGSAIHITVITSVVEHEGKTTRVSVDSVGLEGNNSSTTPSISGDGRYIAFNSMADNLVSNDTNGQMDIFVHDRQLGITDRVSVDSNGNEVNYPSFGPSISADGRYVAFISNASNLVLGDTNNAGDVFVHDRQTGATEIVSVDSAGIQGNSDSYTPSISADGRYVAFISNASNLVPGDTNNAGDVFVHDRQTGATEIVSVDSAGIQGNSDSYTPSISADGRYVAFISNASNLVPGDTNGNYDVFVHDRQVGITDRVSVDSNGNEANYHSFGPSISADGKYVAFISNASNLVPGDTNGMNDTFVHDRQTGATESVSVDSAGIQGNSDSYTPSISAGGRYVAFISDASNLVPGDTNNVGDVFVHDRQLGITDRVSVDSNGNEANYHSFGPSISAGGRYIAFVSEANTLVPWDTNNVQDIFVRDRGVTIESIVLEIDEMYMSGEIVSIGTANSLSSLLDTAFSAQERENIHASINILNAFINRVEAMPESRITPEAATSLIDTANQIIIDLQLQQQ